VPLADALLLLDIFSPLAGLTTGSTQAGAGASPFRVNDHHRPPRTDACTKSPVDVTGPRLALSAAAPAFLFFGAVRMLGVEGLKVGLSGEDF